MVTKTAAARSHKASAKVAKAAAERPATEDAEPAQPERAEPTGKNAMVSAKPVAAKRGSAAGHAVKRARRAASGA